VARACRNLGGCWALAERLAGLGRCSAATKTFGFGLASGAKGKIEATGPAKADRHEETGWLVEERE